MDTSTAILATLNQAAADQADDDAFNASIERARAAALSDGETLDPAVENAALEGVGAVIVSSMVLPLIMQTISMAKEATEEIE